MHSYTLGVGRTSCVDIQRQSDVRQSDVRQSDVNTYIHAFILVNANVHNNVLQCAAVCCSHAARIIALMSVTLL